MAQEFGILLEPSVKASLLARHSDVRSRAGQLGARLNTAEQKAECVAISNALAEALAWIVSGAWRHADALLDAAEARLRHLEEVSTERGVGHPS
jgi:hypothetical protein